MLVPIILLVAIYILNIIDYQQTVYAVNLAGLSVEINPVGRFLLSQDCAGIVKIFIVPVVLFAIGYIVKLDKKQIWAVYFLLVLFTCLVVNNFIQIHNIQNFLNL